MKYRKRQYLQCFWWSSRRIMSSTKGYRSASYFYSVLSLLAALLFIPFSDVDYSVFRTIMIVDATTELSPRVVFTKQGPVQGFLGPGKVGAHYQPQTDGTFLFRHFGKPVVEIFKSIPYASPPVGNLRYEISTPPLRSMADTYIANVTKPACPVSYWQVLNRTNVPGDPIRALKKELDADDCLYLDIYVPLNTLYDQISGIKNSRGSGLPVLVVANSQADDPQNPFDGSSMAAIGNIVVVVFRYRVGVLGFVRPGYTDDIRTNFGLWDQLAALQWIKENIQEFGGSPDNICLMGYDLDATLAGLISLSPVSQAYNGLFHRLILLNGSPFSPNGINHQPQETTSQMARNLRCPIDERSSGELANCFRRIPTPQLFGAVESIGASLLTYPFAPIADGTLVPVDVSRMDQRTAPSVLDMLAKYDLLCGLKEGPVLPITGRPILQHIDLASFVTAAIKLTLKLENDVEPTDQLKREVLKALTDVYGFTPPLQRVVSDFLVVYPINELLKIHSNYTRRNTFFYIFKDFDPLRLNKNNEISYIFSTKVYDWQYHSAIPDYRHLVNDARAEELKPPFGGNAPRPDLYPFVALIRLLANFVRSGDPNVMDPNERFPKVREKPWPKFEKEIGRYLRLGREVEFPSGYRRTEVVFWEQTFPDILKRFSIQSEATDPYQFPPYFPQSPFAVPPTPFPGEDGNDSDNGEGNLNEDESVLSGIQQNTVVLIGALLLLLNFLCFLGLFYQRERLKKTELQLRRRFLDSHRPNPEVIHEMDTASSFERAIPIPNGNHIHHHADTPARDGPMDAMSETETENGFGPDFLGPNYDPRTKVNRWMNMQNAHRAMLSKDNSFENPSPSFSDFHAIHRRETDMPDPSITVLPLPPPLQPSPAHHLHHHPPLHIQVTSLQRNSHPQKYMPMYDHHQHHHPPPVQILPPLPYQEPFQPSASLVSDIPYADSRNTSPLTISSPVGYSNTSSLTRQKNRHEPYKVMGHVSPQPPSSFPNSPSMSTNYTDQQQINPPPIVGTSNGPISGAKSPTSTLKKEKSAVPPSPTDQEKNPKRTSVLIVRDLDPIDDQLDMSEPKLVPVKTGTLKRSVGVDTGHDGSPSKKEGNADTQQNNKRGSSQIRVTFSEKV